MMKEINKYIPIQMIGTQRSGSNLLRLMLNELDDVVSPHPPHILERFFPLLPNYGDIRDADNFKVLIEDVCMLVDLNPVPWNIELNRDMIFERCHKHTLVELTKVLYEYLAEQNHKSYWCCKSLATVHYLNEIEDGWDKPYYIHLFRDGRDVACSFKKAVVGEKHIYFIAKQWVKEQELAIKHCEKVGNERFIRVRYEEFIQYPEQTIKGICAMLKVNYTNNVMKYYESKESKSTAQSGEMWANVVKPVIKNNYNKYKSELSETDIKIFESVAGDTLRKLGYETSSTPKMIINVHDIEEYTKQNELMKKQILDSIPKEDLLKRKPQSELIKSIKERYS